jgi:DNA/RNA endonuclease YhcR with UshA esterase domain
MCTRLLRLCLLLLVVSVRPALAQSVYADRYTLNTGPCTVSSGSGSPEGAVTGVVCDTYLRTDTADLYTKVSGSGTTGWAILPRLAAANSWTATQTHANNTALQWLDSGAAAHTMLKLDNLDRASINPDAFLLAIGGATTFSGTVVMQSTLNVTGAVAGASYTGGAISGTTGAFSSTVTLTSASEVITGGGITLDNGQYYKAKRNTGAAVLNVLGFDSGTDDLYLRISNSLNVRNTGNVDVVTVSSTGVTAIAAATTIGGVLTVNGLGTHTFSASSAAGGNVISVQNPTAGAAAFSGFQIGTDVSSTHLVVRAFSSTFTTAGANVVSGAIVGSSGSGGLSLSASGSGDVRVYSRGTLAATFGASQALALTGALDVTGAATFASNAGTSSYVSQTTGWRITNPGAGDLRSIVVDSLNAKSYIINYEQALAGGQLITKSAAALSAAFTVPAVGGGSGIAITRVGAVATANTSPFAHGLTSGDSVWISGATQTEYNGLFTATVTDSTHFTFPVSGTPATPATGTIVSRGAATLDVEDLPGSPGVALFQIGDQIMLRSVSRNSTTTTTGGFAIGSVYGSIVSGATFLTGHQQWVFARNTAIVGTGTLDRGVTIAAKAVALDFGTSGSGWIEQTVNDGTIDSVGITRVGATATATTAIAHGYKTGDVVYISGATAPEYNGAFTITVTGTTTFTFTVSGTPATPATGTILVNATNGTNAPYTQVNTFTGAPAPSTTSVRCRWGNLRGLTGTLEYGSFCGSFSGNAYVRFSDQNAEIKGIPLSLLDGSTVTVKLDPSVPSFALGNPLPSAYGTGVGVWMGKDSGSYKFRVGDPAAGKIDWNGSALTAAGWTIATSAITATNISLTSGAANTANITVGTGSNAGGLNSANAGSDIAIWAGSTFANRATAPFRVTAAGAVTATSGTVGGWTLGSTSLSGSGTISVGALTIDTSGIAFLTTTSGATDRAYRFTRASGGGGSGDEIDLSAFASSGYHELTLKNRVVSSPTSTNANGAIRIESTGWNGSTLAAATTASILMQSGDSVSGSSAASIGLSATTLSLTIDSTSTGVTLLDALAANTSGDGITLKNTQIAAAGSQRYSPRMTWYGDGWKTNATAGRQSVAMFAEVRPVQGTVAPSGKWVIAGSIAGAGALDVLSVTTDGVFAVGPNGAVTIGTNAAGDRLGGGGTGDIIESVGGPSITAGYATGAVAGYDFAFKISITNAGATGGTITFGHTWTNAPICTANGDGNAAITNSIAVSSTTTTVILAHNAVGAASKIYVQCTGY